ncbi:hypothetical protein QL919_07470 [Psychrobacter sp. APC 3426]|uniref:hypothetical protein n=1 Tax=Psychrobacter sp. APC 3426 TaxID=3035177 RepID=UPI0025B518EA|nr:hypothetical protein [Psychrobacter sp. APC 3426]MDN3398562.1 hypothetical protein [Psychrobacter sp. APC 3426]
MKNKKNHPLLDKRLKGKAANSSRKIWIAIILALLFIAVAYGFWQQSEPKTSEPISQSSTSVPSMDEQTEVAQAAASTATEASQSAEAAMSHDTSTDDTTIDEGNNLVEDSEANAATSPTPKIQVPSPTAILNAPLPKNDSLAKEEIDRLEDERKRLAEQEKLAAEQLAMNKQLTDMKAEQIALLEQQIAQLEANNPAETAVE